MKSVSVYKETQSSLEFICIFRTIAEASKSLGIHKSQISRCMNKVQHYNSAHGYKFYPFVTDDRENITLS